MWRGEGFRLTRNQKQIGSTRPLSRVTKKKLLEPGYWVHLEDGELEFSQSALQNNPKLSYAWGFHPVQKSRAPDAIRRVAMLGDAKDREVNTKMIRGNGRKPAVSKPNPLFSVFLFSW